MGKKFGGRKTMIDEKKRKEKIARYNLHFCIREEWLKLDTTDIDMFFVVIQMLLKDNKHEIYYGFIKATMGNKEVEIPRAFPGYENFFMVERLFDEGIDDVIEKIEEEKKIPRFTKEWYEEHIAHLKSVKRNREELLHSRKGCAVMDFLQKEIDDLDMSIKVAENLYEALFGRK